MLSCSRLWNCVVERRETCQNRKLVTSLYLPCTTTRHYSDLAVVAVGSCENYTRFVFRACSTAAGVGCSITSSTTASTSPSGGHSTTLWNVPSARFARGALPAMHRRSCRCRRASALSFASRLTERREMPKARHCALTNRISLLADRWPGTVIRPTDSDPLPVRSRSTGHGYVLLGAGSASLASESVVAG